MMLKKYMLPALLIAVVLNFAFVRDASFALDVKKANPHELSSQDSTRINNENQLVVLSLATVSVIAAIVILTVILRQKRDKSRQKTKRVRKK